MHPHQQDLGIFFVCLNYNIDTSKNEPLTAVNCPSVRIIPGTPAPEAAVALAAAELDEYIYFIGPRILLMF